MKPHIAAKLILFALIFLLASSAISVAQAPASKTEALVTCNELLQPEPKTHYGFAKATLVSIWYARNASERASEINPDQGEKANPISVLTAIMRAVKNSTNDFVCAKRALQPFKFKSGDENTRTTAVYLSMVYDQHIDLNQRALNLLKKLTDYNQPDFMTKLADQLSTLQVERDQRWSDLVVPTTLALGLLVDMTPTDDSGNFLPDTEANREKGKTMRFAITKAQKQSLLDWAGEHFPEFVRSPKNKWSPPASIASTYVDFLNGGRKCSDE